jgi:uncharacterized protein with gpF-like domain
MGQRLKSEFERVAREASTSWEKTGTYGRAMTDHADRLLKIFQAYYLSVMKAFSLRILKAAPVKALVPHLETKDAEDELESFIAQWSQTNAAKKVVKVSATTETRINRAVSYGIQNGLTRAEIGKRIVEKTGESIGAVRAHVIARTEVHAASLVASFESAKSIGAVTKEWVATEDARTREDHGEVDGDVVAMNEPFLVPSTDGEEPMMYPGDPSASAGNVINCRCVLVYNQEPDEEEE